MIIVSGSSAELTPPVRTCRYTLARRRSLAVRNDARKYVEVRRISVHTKSTIDLRSTAQCLPVVSINYPVLEPSTGRPRAGLGWCGLEKVVGLLVGS